MTLPPELTREKAIIEGEISALSCRINNLQGAMIDLEAELRAIDRIQARLSNAEIRCDVATGSTQEQNPTLDTPETLKSNPQATPDVQNGVNTPMDVPRGTVREPLSPRVEALVRATSNGFTAADLAATFGETIERIKNSLKNLRDRRRVYEQDGRWHGTIMGNQAQKLIDSQTPSPVRYTSETAGSEFGEAPKPKAAFITQSGQITGYIKSHDVTTVAALIARYGPEIESAIRRMVASESIIRTGDVLTLRKPAGPIPAMPKA